MPSDNVVSREMLSNPVNPYNQVIADWLSKAYKRPATVNEQQTKTKEV